MSFLSVSRIGLPIIAGISFLSFPQSMNEPKSRSFYQDDQSNTTTAPIEPESIESSAKPIEKKPSAEITTEFIDGHKINTSSFLESHLNVVRTKIIDELNYADAEYRNLKSATLNEWNNLTENVVSLYDPKDQFLPSFIYALTGSLLGSIIVNKKSLPVRFFTPILFGIAGFKLFLPRTFTNTFNSIKSYEAEAYPELLQYQRSFKQSIIEAEQNIEKFSEDSQNSLTSSIHDIRELITK